MFTNNGDCLVGVFAPEGHSSVEDAGGLIHTGSFYLLGIQAFTCVVIAGWTIICAFIELKVNKIFLFVCCDFFIQSFSVLIKIFTMSS